MGCTGEHKEVMHLSRHGRDRGGPLLFRVMPLSKEQAVA